MKERIKKLCASFLAAAMVFTFMPTMALTAFADAGDPDEVVCTITMSTGDVITRESLNDAQTAVDDGGSIKVTGSVNNSFTVAGSKAYSIDFSEATLADGVTIKPADTACWVGKDGKFSYHQNHTWTNAEATATANDTTKANVTIHCANGDSTVEHDVVGTEKSSTDEHVTYTATVQGFTVEWTVPIEAQTVTYALGTVDYVKAGDDLAIFKDGKVQFFATYTKKVGSGAAETVLDENGDPAKLAGTIVGEPIADTPAHPATETAYGSHTYHVAFTFPDGTKYSEGTGANKVEYATVSGVVDTEKLSPTMGNVKGIAFQYVFADGKKTWGAVLNPGSSVAQATTIDNKSATLDVADDGTLTYALVYYDKNSASTTDSIFGDAVELKANSASVVKACGAATFKYDAVSKRYTGTDGEPKTFTFTVNDITRQGTHSYETRSTWAANFTATKQPTHSETGVATASCQYCDFSVTDFVIPKKDDHVFKQENNADKVVTVDPTCKTYGFQYKICTTEDGNWTDDGKYVLKLDNEVNGKTYTFNSRTGFAAGEHPVLVEGSVKDLIPHKYYVVNEQINWSTDDSTSENAVTASLRQRCMLEGEGADVQNYTYHQLTFAEYKVLNPTAALDNGSEDTMTVSGVVHVFGAITPTVAKGADCSQANQITYTVNGVTKADGSAITKTAASALVGPHTYKNTVTFSKDGKTAKVLQECTKCSGNAAKVDADGNKGLQEKDAVVTATENADGSTTYTATLEGVELTNNTKTVFDLSKATVTFNEGAELDINTLPTNATEKAEALKKMVKVTINGAEISNKLYTTDLASITLKAGANKFTVSPASDAANVVGEAKGVANCIKPGQLTFSGFTVKDNGEEKTVTGTEYDKQYDGKTVEVAIGDIVKYQSNPVVKIENATVKYAVADYDDDTEPSKLTYDLDKVELTDAGDYNVFVKIEKEGYTTVYMYVVNIEIHPIEVYAAFDGATFVEGEAPDINIVFYGRNNKVVDIDRSLVKVKSVGGKELNELKPGTYDIYVTVTDNYTVLNGNPNYTLAKVTVVSKDGKTAEEEAAAQAQARKEANAAVEEAKKIDDTYPAESKAAVDAARAEVEKVLSDKNASSSDINTAVDKLNKAINDAKAAKAATVKKANPMKASGKTIKAKASKKMTFKKAKAFKVTAAQGKVTFKKAKGNKKIVVKSNGKVIVKKGLKKGKTYKVKVKVTAAGNATYKKVTKTVTLKVKVK